MGETVLQGPRDPCLPAREPENKHGSSLLELDHGVGIRDRPVQPRRQTQDKNRYFNHSCAVYNEVRREVD